MLIPLRYKRGFLLSFIIFSIILFSQEIIHASNYIWTQTDWSGGANPGATARHPEDQSGWTRFSSKDTYINNSITGNITLSPRPTSITQTGDVGDFDRGILTRVKIVGNGGYLATRYEENNPKVTTSGTWGSTDDSLASGGKYIYSRGAGSRVYFTFTGSGVKFIGFKGPNYGIANIYLDDVSQGIADLYNSALQSQQVLWSIAGLASGTHTLIIEVSGTKNNNSSDNWIGVDAFDALADYSDPGAYLMLVDGDKYWTQTADIEDFDLGKLTDVKIVGSGGFLPTRYEENSPEVTTSGTWGSTDDSLASGGKYIYSRGAGSRVYFTFTGKEVKFIGFKGPNYGIANIYLDDVSQGTADLYNSTLQSQQVLWSITGLASVTHTLIIEVSGTKNNNSSDYWIGVDAFDASVPNPDPGAYLMLIDGVYYGVYESPSFDSGADGSFFPTINWTATVPSGSRLRFQIATNNDNSTWNFLGPDGTTGTYYETPGAAINTIHNKYRYIRYRAIFERQTVNPADSPILKDITIKYVPTIYQEGSYESPTFDTGAGGAFYSSITWTAPPIPSGSRLRIQIATNNDNSTWNFLGPDGTAGTYYETSGTAIHPGHNKNRYIRYRAIFERQTVNPADSPILNDVTINYLAYPPVQSLISSPYDTIDDTNVINRLMWSEALPPGTEVVLQVRTSPDNIAWSQWYGPIATTFSASLGDPVITVTDATGFTTGSLITLTNSTNPNEMETKKIVAIDITNKLITLASATSYNYGSGSTLTNTYADPGGTEQINPIHRSGYNEIYNDRWIEYRAFLYTESGTETPTFLEIRTGYNPAIAKYQPDGVIEGNGDNVYGSIGTGTGGSFTKASDPGFKLLQPLTYDIRVQNDSSPQAIDDKLLISWNTPSDISGNWTVYLNDGVTDLISPVSMLLNTQSEKIYTMKITPSPRAPADSVKDVIIDIRSESDYYKVDSIKATTQINKVYQVDGLIDGAGDNIYDLNKGGGGGISLLKDAGPGDILIYNITLQNEGNISDTYAISLLNPLPTGWMVLINDGSKDYDITNPANNWITPSINPLPYSDFEKSYTLKVIPKGPPATVDIILNIYSNGAKSYLDSLTARVDLLPTYKVDGVIYGFGYDESGNLTYGVTAAGCGVAGPGDNIYGTQGSGNGGCAALDITAGSTRVVSAGIQNEGNIPDRYLISWNLPTGWAVVLQERLNDGSILEFNSPVEVPTAAPGNPSAYNGGEVLYFAFKVTLPATFTSGSQSIIFDIQSKGNANKVDSLKLVINSGDTTPPSPVVLNTDNITDTSIRVKWTAPGDDGIIGTAKSYDLRYSALPITTDTEFNKATRVRGCKTGESNLNSPKASGGSESCTVSQLFANTGHYFALKTSDDVGNRSPLSACSTCPALTLPSGDTTVPGSVSDLTITDTSITKDPDTQKEIVRLTLCWTAPSDNGTDVKSGPVTGYDLRYSTRSIVDDSIIPGVGRVIFSSAKVAVPEDGWSPPRSPGIKECYIVPVENEIDTGGGIIEDRTRNTRFYFAVKVLDEAYNKSNISNLPAGLTPLVSYSYNMVSLPYVPVPNTPKDVFGDDVGSRLNIYWWDSRGPNFDNGCYNGVPDPYSTDSANYTCTKLTSVKEGLGYFLWTPSGNFILDVPGGSTQAPVQSCTDDLGDTFQCYALPLQEGWNMIGTTFDREINLSSRDLDGVVEKGLFVRRTSINGVKVSKFQDAVTAENWIDGALYTYNGVNYTYEVCDMDKPNEPLGTRCSIVLQPWKAYWMRLRVLGGATFELLIPGI